MAPAAAGILWSWTLCLVLFLAPCSCPCFSLEPSDADSVSGSSGDSDCPMESLEQGYSRASVYRDLQHKVVFSSSWTSSASSVRPYTVANVLHIDRSTSPGSF